MDRIWLLLLLFTLLPAQAEPQVEGLVRVQSMRDVADTMRELEQGAKARGLQVFNLIDHAAGAESIGQSLRPAQLLIVGHPKAGTALMQCAPALGLELPLKVLVREDAQGKVWLEYNDPFWLAGRYHVAACAALAGVQNTLRQLVDEAAGRRE